MIKNKKVTAKSEESLRKAIKKFKNNLESWVRNYIDVAESIGVMP